MKAVGHVYPNSHTAFRWCGFGMVEFPLRFGLGSWFVGSSECRPFFVGVAVSVCFFLLFSPAFPCGPCLSGFFSCLSFSVFLFLILKPPATAFPGLISSFCFFF